MQPCRLVFLSLVAATLAGSASVISVHGANGIRTTGFGLEPGNFPHDKTSPGDSGADAGIFNPGANPNPACGRTWRGPINIAEWVQKFEKHGVPSAYPNGSVVADMFQVIAPGGGPAVCEFDPSATGRSFTKMTMNLNMQGNFGLRYQSRVNSTIVATFPTRTTCNGGAGKNLCLIRCRSGQNLNGGGCFVVRLSSKTYISTFKRLASVNPGNKLAARSIELIKKSANNIVETIKKRDAAEMGDAVEL